MRHWKSIKSKRFVLFSVLVATFVLVGAGAVSFWNEGLFLSEKEQISKLTEAIVPDSSVVFDRNGEKIGEYYSFYHVFVPFEKIPKPMIDALLAIEDRKFFEHKGVNWRSMGRALSAVLSSGRLRQGGSTLTMQLVKNYLLTREKKVSRKLREIILSYYVEKNLSKERILELYLNTMYMGHGAYGIGAAAQTYFSKTVDQMEIHEFALLAGLFQAPSAFDPHKNLDAAVRRQRMVLDAMVAAKFLKSDEALSWKSRTVVIKPWLPLNETVAPFYISWVRQLVQEKLGDDDETINDRGLRIYTSLDKNLQLVANKAMERQEPNLKAFQATMRLKKNDRLEAALLVTDPKDGSILAMVGGRNFRESQFNRAATAKRSPGSSFKPVIYSLALEKGMSWSDLVFVSPLNVGGYRPKNHEGEEMTEVTMIKALARSMNTPVVSLAQKFGIDAVLERAKKMGIKSDMPREIGISIGGFSATMADVARLYGTIANHGVSKDTWSLQKIVDRSSQVLYERRVESEDQIDEEAFSSDVSDLLRSGLQAVMTHGTGTAVSDLASVAAGKTGTSDDSRDNWFCGFTKSLVAVSWVGTDGHSGLGRNASGASLALPIWGDFMRGAINGVRPAEPWSIPDGMVTSVIDPDFGTPSEDGITALFLAHKVPKASQASQDMRSLKETDGAYRGMKVDD